MLIIIIELLVVLLALYLGSKYGSLALGAIAGLGLAILVFDHGLKPGTPPTDVIYIIVAAVTCAGVLQASGGMDWMIQIVERILRKHPMILVTSYLDPDTVRRCNMIPASTPDEALSIARSIKGENASVVVIPDGVSVMAVAE